MTRDGQRSSKDLVPIRSAAPPPPYNKAHSAIYALMSYELLTTIRKTGDLMGLTQAQIEERKAKEAAEAAEKQVDDQTEGGDTAEDQDTE